MKTCITVCLVSLLNISLQFLPTGTLMVAMGAAVALDFLTGVIKASLTNKARTSQGYRRTVTKFMQYGGAVCVSMLMKYLVSLKGPGTMEALAPYADFLNDGLLFFIIFIEITSIVENLYAIDSKSPFAVYFIKPMLKVMTFAVKNNSFSKSIENEKDANQNLSQ